MSSHDESKKGLICDALGFLELLSEMEKEGQDERVLSGEIEGPFYSKAVISCKVRLGIDRDDKAKDEMPKIIASCSGGGGLLEEKGSGK